jgi:hypothetical protein
MKKHLSYPFAEETPSTAPASPTQNADASEYQFEGFTVVINQKITLTPIQRDKKRKHG